MSNPKRSNDDLIEKIENLPPDKLAEVEIFVDSLSHGGVHGASKLSEASFREVWDNPDDADYDRL